MSEESLNSSLDSSEHASEAGSGSKTRHKGSAGTLWALVCRNSSWGSVHVIF